MDLPEIPEANEIIEGLFVGTAQAGTEATVGGNRHQIGYVLNVGGCVTPAILAALVESLAETERKEGDEGEEEKEEEVLWMFLSMFQIVNDRVVFSF